MLETLFTSLTASAIKYAIKESGVIGTAKALTGRDPKRLAFQEALMTAFKAVQADYPDLESILFDEHFLKHGAGPLLSRYWHGPRLPNATELAAAWGAQLGLESNGRDSTTVTRVAEAYLRAFEQELGKRDGFGHVYQIRILGTLADIDQAVRQSPVGELRRVRDLARSSFSLGDDEAANFSYVVDPIRDCWGAAERMLRSAEQRSGQIDILLILGAANSGKTRLAVEALMATLPDWFVLRWRPDYGPIQIPSDVQIGDLDLVVFADDLHEYVTHSRSGAELQLAGTDQSAMTFQTLLERVCACTHQSVVVATCRDEYEDDVVAAMPHVISRAQTIRLPTFAVDEQNPTSRELIAAFQLHGARHCAEWDGTVGSLILGLEKKRSQYLALRSRPAGAILRAMKLLTAARTREHTKRRIQLVCDKVFGETQLGNNPALWDAAVEELTRLQFVIEDIRDVDGALRLTVRKDAYLEGVLADYPNPRRPSQEDSHFAGLRAALIDDRDANALSNLGVAYFDRRRLDDALAIYSDVLTLEPTLAIAWQNTGNALYALGRHQEALNASDRSIELEPTNSVAWGNRGAILAGLGQAVDALDAFDRSLELDPTNEITTINRCSVLTKLGRTSEALPILEGLRATQHDNATFWHNFGQTLQESERWAEALSAYDHALVLAPENAATAANRIAILGELGRFDEALASSEVVNDESQWAELVWHNRGEALRKVGDFEAAIAAFDRALQLRPATAISLISKAATLIDVGRPGEALEVAVRTLKTFPDSKQAWNNQGRCELELGLLDRAVVSFNCAIVLDQSYDTAWTNKGVALARLNRLSEAAESFRRACEIKPSNSAAVRNLSQALAALAQMTK